MLFVQRGSSQAGLRAPSVELYGQRRRSALSMQSLRSAVSMTFPTGFMPRPVEYRPRLTTKHFATPRTEHRFRVAVSIYSAARRYHS